MPHDDYPASVAEILDDDITYKPETLRAMRAFQKAKPWSGILDERKEKFRRLNKALAVIYGIAEPELAFGLIINSGLPCATSAS